MDEGWTYVILGGVLEVISTTCLRYTEGVRNIPWTGAFIACMLLSLLLVNLATRTIPLGTAYAVWTGLGAMGTVVIGMVMFQEPVALIRIVLVMGIVGCVAGLKLTH